MSIFPRKISFPFWSIRTLKQNVEASIYIQCLIRKQKMQRKAHQALAVHSSRNINSHTTLEQTIGVIFKQSPYAQFVAIILLGAVRFAMCTDAHS
jgi:hypothetical protein